MKISVKKNRRKKAKKNQQPASPNGFRNWLAIGTASAIVAGAALSGITLPAASAKSSQRLPASIYALAQTPSPAQRFDIPPGALDLVLSAYQNTTGIRIEVEHQAIRTINSPGVSGVFKVEQALKQLLTGTGISYRFTGATSVTLELEAVKETIEVTGDSSTISPKYTEPLRDTPQSISVLPRQVIEAQGATTLRDTLRNVAGISLAAGEGGAQGDSLTVRGFTARNDIFIDGMRDFGSYYRDPFNLEEVEVLKGPSSVTFGRGTTGGIVNQASKMPQMNRFMSGSVNFGTDATRRLTVDLNQPLGKLGTGTAFRLNLMGTDAGVAGRDIAENRRYGIAPSLTMGLGTPTRLTLSYLHQTANDIPDYGIPWLFNAPAPVPRDNYYGFRRGNFLKTSVDIGTVKLEHNFNQNISVRSQLRYSYYRRDVQISEARIAGTVTPTTPLRSIIVNRNQITAKSDETFLQNQTDVTARFSTGFIKHTLVGGLEIGRELSEPTRRTFTNVPTTSLLNPDTTQRFSGNSTISSRVRTVGRTVAAYALDTIKLGEKWELVGGVRWERFAADFRQFVAPIAAFNRVDRMTSWRGAVVYKPQSIGSIYFSYGTSFNPSAESLALSASTANTPPEKNRNFEIGSKWDIFSKKLSLRGAIFRTEKTNARETDPNNPLQNVLSGSQRVEGFEVEATGRLTSRWQILSSYAYLDSELVKSKAFPKAIGSQLANVPKNTFSLWTNYLLPRWKMEVGGGGQFVDSRTASATAPLDPVTRLVRKAPGYWVMNAQAKYRLNERLDLQVNVNNLANKYYFDQLHPGHIVPGPGRSALIGLNFKL